MHRCVTCGVALPDGYKMLNCDGCRKMQNRKYMMKYEERVQKGLCPRCEKRKEAQSEHIFCAECREKARKTMAERVQQRKSERRCIRCGIALKDDEGNYCTGCVNKRREK